MQATHLLNHALELRLAFALLTAASLFAVVKIAYIIDEKVSAFLASRRTGAKQPNYSGKLAIAGAAN